MNFTGRVKNTLPVKFITPDFASLGIFVQKMYKAEGIISHFVYYPRKRTENRRTQGLASYLW
jgi:hypothetical protein